MKNAAARKSVSRPQPQIRAQRREAERKTARQRQARRSTGFSRASVFGGAVTIVVFLAILGYGVYQSMRVTNNAHTAGGLVNAAALSPVPNLLSTGQQAPNFTLKDPTTGRTYSLASQRGHPVLIEFFALWCPICHGEAPIMTQLTKNYVPRGVRVWSILANPYGPNYESSGYADLSLATRADFRWYARSYQVHHPQLIDPQFNTVNRYGINGYPGFYIIDGHGIIRYVADGHTPYGTLAKALNTVLARGGKA